MAGGAAVAGVCGEATWALKWDRMQLYGCGEEREGTDEQSP
jgi:hypothetical protein